MEEALSPSSWVKIKNRSTAKSEGRRELFEKRAARA